MRVVDAALAAAVALFVTGLAFGTVGLTADLALCALPILATGLSAIEAWREDLSRVGVLHVGAPGRLLGVPAHRLVRIDRLMFGLFGGSGYGLAVGYHLVGAAGTGPADLSAACGRRRGAVLACSSRALVGRDLSTVKEGRTAGAITSSSLCAAMRRRLPLRLGRFLDWAHEGGLLRVDGTSYRFRHDEFEQYLWRRHWRSRLVPAAVDAALRVLRGADGAPDRPTAARRIREGVREFEEYRRALPSICPRSAHSGPLAWPRKSSPRGPHGSIPPAPRRGGRAAATLRAAGGPSPPRGGGAPVLTSGSRAARQGRAAGRRAARHRRCPAPSRVPCRGDGWPCPAPRGASGYPVLALFKGSGFGTTLVKRSR